MHQVTVKRPDGTAISTSLEAGRCIIGRRRRRDDLTVDLVVSGDPTLSAAHLAIYDEDGALSIEDLESTNGTYLDAERLQPGRRYPLQIGQLVSLGGALLAVTETVLDTWVGRWPSELGVPKYVAVLYTDICQSAAMTERLGQHAALVLQNWHNERFRERFKRYRGRENKFTGDGFEALFPSVNQALACAASCQRALARRNQEVAAEQRLHVRMGISCGEALVFQRREYGMPLIVAQRVMTEADGRQVYVPAHVLDVVASGPWTFTPVGRRVLKGLQTPVELYEFHWWQDPFPEALPRAEQPS